MAADQGHPKAEHALGVCYRDGEGVENDAAEARKWFHRAAVRGHVLAQCSLGLMLVQGTLSGQGPFPGLGDGEIWLKKAAAAGDALAIKQLARFHGIMKQLAREKKLAP